MRNPFRTSQVSVFPCQIFNYRQLNIQSTRLSTSDKWQLLVQGMRPLPWPNDCHNWSWDRYSTGEHLYLEWTCLDARLLLSPGVKYVKDSPGAGTKERIPRAWWRPYLFWQDRPVAADDDGGILAAAAMRRHSLVSSTSVERCTDSFSADISSPESFLTSEFLNYKKGNF